MERVVFRIRPGLTRFGGGFILDAWLRRQGMAYVESRCFPGWEIRSLTPREFAWLYARVERQLLDRIDRAAGKVAGR